MEHERHEEHHQGGRNLALGWKNQGHRAQTAQGQATPQRAIQGACPQSHRQAGKELSYGQRLAVHLIDDRGLEEDPGFKYMCHMFLSNTFLSRSSSDPGSVGGREDRGWGCCQGSDGPAKRCHVLPHSPPLSCTALFSLQSRSSLCCNLTAKTFILYTPNSLCPSPGPDPVNI